MTRTTKYKAIYFATLAVAVLIGVAVVLLLRGHVPVALGLIVLAGLMPVPGLVQRHFWADMIAGLYHLNHGNYAASRTRSERFLTQLQARPWLKRLIWLGTSSYSRDVEVMTRNNLGAALLKLGEIEAARQELERAIALDPECPLPYRNMGVLLLQTGPSAQAIPWIDKAVSLGLTGDWSDRIVRSAQHRNATRATGGADDGLPAAKAAPQAVPDGAFVVVLRNDDHTPFDVVVACLEQAFGLTGIAAIRIARAASLSGQAPCAAFDTEAEAQAAANRFQTLARDGGHALSCTVMPGGG